MTSEFGKGFKQIQHTLKAIDKLKIQTIWLWPNIDAGSDEISKGLRLYRERNRNSKISFFKNFEIDVYIF